MARRAFLHIGQGKTGTSTVQGFLSKNRAALAERGYLYPSLSGNQRHLELSLYGKGERMVRSSDWWRIPWDTPEELVAQVEEELPAQIVESRCNNVVLSDEALYRLRPAVRRVAEVLRSVTEELVLVIYLRRQDEHVVSRYKQTMREGSGLLLSEFIARPQTLRTWQYDVLLRALAEDHPGVRIAVRPYDRARFRNGSLVQDFLEAIELPDFAYEDAGDEINYNTSFDAHTTEYLRRYNARHGRAPLALRRQLTTLSDGPDLRMEDEEHRAMWDHFLPGNERLVREFVPGTEDIFLAPPRTRRGITQAEVTEADLGRVGERLAADEGPRMGS